MKSNTSTVIHTVLNADGITIQYKMGSRVCTNRYSRRINPNYEHAKHRMTITNDVFDRNGNVLALCDCGKTVMIGDYYLDTIRL